jgi:hypothetical protein
VNMRKAKGSPEQREKRRLQGRPGEATASPDREADSQSSAIGRAWDPYEVWLTRVKKPREEIERVRARGESRANSARSAATDSPSGLHPILNR